MTVKNNKCKTCGDEFKYEYTGGRERHYCSHYCKKFSKLKYKREWYSVNTDRVREYNKNYYLSNKKDITDAVIQYSGCQNTEDEEIVCHHCGSVVYLDR